MTQNDLDSLKINLKLYIARHPNMKNTALAELFLDENTDIKLSVRSIRRYVSLMKEAEEILEDDVTITEDSEESEIKESEESFDENKLFLFKYSGKDYTFDRSTLDLVACAYSRYGLNLTAPVIQTISDLSYDEIKVIISKLKLTKESNPYSDYSAEYLTADALNAELEANIDFLLDRLYERDGSAATKLVKLNKKQVILAKNKELRFKSIVSGLKDLLPKIELNKFKFNNDIINDSAHTHIIIPDMHIGLHQNNYNNDIIRHRLNEIATYLEFTDNIHVHFMGDIIHSVSGLNHKDSWKNMAKDTTGAEAIIAPYKLLAEFLMSLSGLIRVDMVGGNHGRLASNKAEENTGEAEKLIAFMLNETLVSVPVIFDSYRIIDNTDPNLHVITMHGDKTVDKESGQSVAWEFGDPTKFNYIATAHMHSRKQMPKDDGLRFRKEAVPAFCPADMYAKTVAHPSLPGFKLITSSKNGLPIIADMPIYYDE